MTIAKQRAEAPTRPAFRYHGGKWLLAPWIISHFPNHRVYTEAYGGAASGLLRKPRCFAEVYNDMNGEVVNVFRVLQDPVTSEALRKLVSAIPFARAEFEQSYVPSDDPVRRAANCLVRTSMGFGSAAINPDHQTGFRANTRRCSSTPAHNWADWPDLVPQYFNRLRAVVIENRPALDIIRQHDAATTLHYVDPPYPWRTRTDKNKRPSRHVYAYEMTDDQHAEMAAVLHACKGMVVLSGYACELYDDHLFKDWVRYEKEALADGALPRKEVLWLNPAAATAQQTRRLL